MIELALKYGIKAVSFEKPMAEDMKEAKKMTDLCVQNGVKAIVCHQQKYLTQMQELKKKADRGDFGQIKKIFCGDTALDGSAGNPLCGLHHLGKRRLPRKICCWSCTRTSHTKG